MYLRIYTLVCCAILVGFATAAQTSGQRVREDLDFNVDDLEGSGLNGEVSQDLESSGSGDGRDGPSDDEDTPVKLHVPNIYSEPDTRNKPVPEPDEPIIAKEPVPSSTDNPIITGMNPKLDERHTSFFAQPGILAAVIGGAVVGLLCAILVVMFIVYRMRKKDEGSYALGEPKQSPTTTSYSRGNNKEFYA